MHIPGSSHPQYLGMACHTHSHHVSLCNMSLFSLRGHYTHHMGWGMLGLLQAWRVVNHINDPMI